MRYAVIARDGTDPKAKARRLGEARQTANPTPLIGFRA
jgi:hypothetical protein